MEKYDDDQLEIDFRNNEDIRDILFKANERRLQIERDAGTTSIRYFFSRLEPKTQKHQNRLFRIESKGSEGYIELR